MSTNQALFPIAAMARVLGVSTAGYYAWCDRPPSAHTQADAALLTRVRTIHATSRQLYGAPRVQAQLRADGHRHGRKRFASLMRDAGLVGACHRGSGRMPGQHPTSSIASLPPKAPTNFGSRISPSCRLRPASSISPWWSTPVAARLSAGRWRTTCALNWCSMLWKWQLDRGGHKTSSMMPFRCARTICASAVTRAALSGQLEDARPVLAGRSVLHVANAPTKLPPFDRGGVLPCLVSLLHWPRYDTGTVSLFVIAFASPSGSSRFY
jgi:hypothetical protein